MNAALLDSGQLNALRVQDPLHLGHAGNLLEVRGSRLLVLLRRDREDVEGGDAHLHGNVAE
eukprot:426890-Lingulodinium_polyedra.AAC.1